MELYPALVRHVLAPAYDRIRGTATMRRLAHLEESQWWPLGRIEEQQSLHLQELIARAYAHVPYYRRIMDERGLRPSDIRSAADLAKLPHLTKETIRANRGSLMSRAVLAEQLTTGWSGGTTGERLDYHSTLQERMTYGYARWALTFEWTGLRLGDPHMSIRQQSAHPRSSRLKSTGIRFQRLTRVDALTVREENLHRLVQTIRRIRPKSIASYPSGLALVASYAKAEGIACPRVEAMCLGGEQLLERQEEVLTQVFGTAPYARYGSNELNEVSGQCEVRGGLHILAEDFIIEVVDESGAPTAPGELGTFLITSLHNHGMPFIRYEPGDIGTLLPEACPCGRSLPLMDWRVGRTREYLRSRNGRTVAAMAISVGPLLPPDVVQYHLVQEDYDRFTLSAVPVREPSTGEWELAGNKLAALLDETLGSRVHVEVRLVDRMEANLSGKRLAFISKLVSDAPADHGRAGRDGAPANEVRSG